MLLRNPPFVWNNDVNQIKYANFNHSADYSFISFGIIRPIVVSLKNGVLLMYTLEGVSSIANFITAYEESE